MLFYLFRFHHWSVSELRELHDREDGWQEIIREFSALEIELNRQT